ncbi:MAG: hypothetical protein RR280_05535 [Bacteroidaceae bacterium]
MALENHKRSVQETIGLYVHSFVFEIKRHIKTLQQPISHHTIHEESLSIPKFNSANPPGTL